MKTYYKVYEYTTNPDIHPHNPPSRVYYTEGEDDHAIIKDARPSITTYWLKATSVSKEEYMAAHSATEAPTKVSYPRIEVYKGRDGIWRYHLRSQDGKVSVTNPEKFARKWTAKRGAARFNKKLDQKVPVVVLTPEEIVEVSQREAARRLAAEKAAAKSD